jgi:peptidoglycan/LPS O-acetylase OafA/YrhL
MMARLAALLVFLAMVILLVITFGMNGHNAILFCFVGHPLLLLGLLLAMIALARRLARERAEAAQASSGQR